MCLTQINLLGNINHVKRNSIQTTTTDIGHAADNVMACAHDYHETGVKSESKAYTIQCKPSEKPLKANVFKGFFVLAKNKILIREC